MSETTWCWRFDVDFHSVEHRGVPAPLHAIGAGARCLLVDENGENLAVHATVRSVRDGRVWFEDIEWDDVFKVS